MELAKRGLKIVQVLLGVLGDYVGLQLVEYCFEVVLHSIGFL